MIAEQIHRAVDPEWSGPVREPLYVEFDLMEAHCDAARRYRDVRGGWRWRCRHDPITDYYRDRARGGLAALAR